MKHRIARQNCFYWMAAAAAFMALFVLAGVFAVAPSAARAENAKPPRYTEDVQPIFNKRCIACHGCLGSPCNLKLTSFHATERGGFGKNPYSNHIENYKRTDMGALQTTADWRGRGFFPVLSRGGSRAENLRRSLLTQILETGLRHNKPGFDRHALSRSYGDRYNHQCPATPHALDRYLAGNPADGMPFGLPALSDADFKTLNDWVAAGSPGPSEEELRVAKRVNNPAAVLAWERFFNADDKKSRLVARYIFEHVFLATIVLEESPGDFFRPVRSKTPPARSLKEAEAENKDLPRPIEVIDAPLPYTDPYAYGGVDRFYYRLDKVTTPILQKSHFVWQLKRTDIEHLKTLFFDPPWDPAADLDPPWGVGNPFRVFQAIPARARYRFLLENAELIVSGITNGPVCLGQTATYAVKDHFWVFFVDPDYDVSILEPKLGLDSWDAFMDPWLNANVDYADAYAAALAKFRPKG